MSETLSQEQPAALEMTTTRSPTYEPESSSLTVRGIQNILNQERKRQRMMKRLFRAFQVVCNATLVAGVGYLIVIAHDNFGCTFSSASEGDTRVVTDAGKKWLQSISNDNLTGQISFFNSAIYFDSPEYMIYSAAKVLPKSTSSLSLSLLLFSIIEPDFSNLLTKLLLGQTLAA